MKITAIKAQVKNPDRVSVFIDGKYSFSLSHSQLLEMRLVTGQELDAAQLQKYKDASDYGKLLERSLNYVMIRPRSIKEMNDYLRKKQADPTVQSRIIEYLKSKNYLNDQRFAESWVRSRELTKATSKRRLYQELRQKGVESPIIERVLAERAGNELDALRQTIAKKRRLARYQDDQKLMQYLARQGFGFDDIKQAISEIQ